jgi:hypothetical protein
MFELALARGDVRETQLRLRREAETFRLSLCRVRAPRPCVLQSAHVPCSSRNQWLVCWIGHLFDNRDVGLPYTGARAYRPRPTREVWCLRTISREIYPGDRVHYRARDGSHCLPDWFLCVTGAGWTIAMVLCLAFAASYDMCCLRNLLYGLAYLSLRSTPARSSAYAICLFTKPQLRFQFARLL